MQEKTYETVNMFPVLLMRFPKFLTEEQCEDIIIHHANNPDLRQHGYFTNDALCSHGGNNILNQIIEIDTCRDILNDINSALELYSEISGFRKTTVTNSWLNIQNKGSALYDHMHPNSNVTGAIFVKVNNGSNNLTFANNNMFTWFVEQTYNTAYTARYHDVKPETGDMFLFPSWLKHGSNGQENLTDNRISIAFNSLMPGM